MTAIDTKQELEVVADQQVGSCNASSCWIRDKGSYCVTALHQIAVHVKDAAVATWESMPPADMVSNWIGDKGKYFLESLANAADHLRLMPTLAGRSESQAWTSVNTGLKNAKNVLAFPSVLKGAHTFYYAVQSGAKSVRNLAGDFCYLVGDTIDTIQGGLGMVGSKIPATVQMLGKNMYLAAPVQFLKNVTGVYGLGNTAYNLTLDLEKLKQIDVTQGATPKGMTKKDGVALKEQIVQAEIDNKWYDRLRCVSAAAMCAIGLTVSIGMFGPASPWVFAVLGSVGVYGKYNMYAAKTRGECFQTKYAELLPERVQPLTVK